MTVNSYILFYMVYLFVVIFVKVKSMSSQANITDLNLIFWQFYSHRKPMLKQFIDV